MRFYTCGESGRDGGGGRGGRLWGEGASDAVGRSHGNISDRWVQTGLLSVGRSFPRVSASLTVPLPRVPRQALVLLEYLVKNGSERVVDDARSHVSTVKMLRNFHYIDEKGKDQGINGTWLSLSRPPSSPSPLPPSNYLFQLGGRSGPFAAVASNPLRQNLTPHLPAVAQSVTVQRRLPSSCRTSRRSGPNVERPRRTGQSTRASATTAAARRPRPAASTAASVVDRSAGRASRPRRAVVTAVSGANRSAAAVGEERTLATSTARLRRPRPALAVAAEVQASTTAGAPAPRVSRSTTLATTRTRRRRLLPPQRRRRRRGLS